MWAFFGYLLAATAFYTILVMIAQPEPYESEAWELSDELDEPVVLVGEEHEAYRRAA